MEMYVKVMYFKDWRGDYGGNAYTYATNLELKVGDKVIAPTQSGDKKALVVQVNVPESEINPQWADKIKNISVMDGGEAE